MIWLTKPYSISRDTLTECPKPKPKSNIKAILKNLLLNIVKDIRTISER